MNSLATQRKMGRPLSRDAIYAKKILPNDLRGYKRVRMAGGAEKLEKLSPEVRALLLGVAS